jgi:hypothetical protein
MRLVLTTETDGPLELDVSLVDFERFLKAFVPR